MLLDVFLGDAKHGRRSADALRASLAQGSLIACEIVWAEVSVAFPTSEDAARAMAGLQVAFRAADMATALASGDGFRSYRRAGGPRSRLPADFLIGAHATTTADRLLTRDRGFYRAYFKDLPILDPS